MAQNTFVVQRGSLTIKYSRYYRVSETQQHKLARSLEMAWSCLDAASKSLVPVQNVADYPDTTKEILAFHFFQNHGVRKPLDDTYRADIRQIARNFARILTGLKAPVVIADAYGTRVGRAWKETKDQFENNMRSMTDMGLPPPSRDDYLREVRKSVREAEEEVKEVRGFVRPKTATAARLRQDGADYDWKKGKLGPGTVIPRLSVQLSPEDLGSIHVNFCRLLRESDDPPGILSIAQTIIHEASHKFINTHDFAYADEKAYGQLDRRQSLLNADSYALSACSLARNCLFRNGDQLKFEEYLASL